MNAMQTRLTRWRTLTFALTVLALALPGSGGAQEAPAATAPATPAATVYNIEIIIFRNNGAQGGSENWGTQGASSRNIAGDETTTGTTQIGRFVALLPSSAYQLSDLESRLRASGAYVPVAHVAWSQTASSWGTRAGFSLQKLGVDVEGLNGTVFLEHGQFLHLGLTLNYAMSAPPPGLNAAAGTVFTINESRRVKFYDRNYFDHPAFGVIALVTPAQGARAPGR
jgi:Peptidoglycan-binding protein, CsiV